jgi:hypothetical protein
LRVSLEAGDQLTPTCSRSRFREKFKSFVEQYEMREIQFHSLLRSKDLEIQYHLARQEQLRKAQDAELSKSHQLTRQVSTFSQTENELRSQLNIYVEKFKQVSLFFFLPPCTKTDGHVRLALGHRPMTLPR